MTSAITPSVTQADEQPQHQSQEAAPSPRKRRPSVLDAMDGGASRLRDIMERIVLGDMPVLPALEQKAPVGKGLFARQSRQPLPTPQQVLANYFATLNSRNTEQALNALKVATASMMVDDWHDQLSQLIRYLPNIDTAIRGKDFDVEPLQQAVLDGIVEAIVLGPPLGEGEHLRPKGKNQQEGENHEDVYGHFIGWLRQQRNFELTPDIAKMIHCHLPLLLHADLYLDFVDWMVKQPDFEMGKNSNGTPRDTSMIELGLPREALDKIIQSLIAPFARIEDAHKAEYMATVMHNMFLDMVAYLYCGTKRHLDLNTLLLTEEEKQRSAQQPRIVAPLLPAPPEAPPGEDDLDVPDADRLIAGKDNAKPEGGAQGLHVARSLALFVVVVAAGMFGTTTPSQDAHASADAEPHQDVKGAKAAAVSHNESLDEIAASVSAAPAESAAQKLAALKDNYVKGATVTLDGKSTPVTGIADVKNNKGEVTGRVVTADLGVARPEKTELTSTAPAPQRSVLPPSRMAALAAGPKTSQP